MDTFSQIIDGIGVKPLAELLGLPENHVRTMKARDSIPPKYWPVITATRSDISIERLFELRAAREARPSTDGEAA